MKKAIVIALLLLSTATAHASEPTIYNQGNSDSCLAHSIVGASKYQGGYESLSPFALHRLVQGESVENALIIATEQGIIDGYTILSCGSENAVQAIAEGRVVLADCVFKRSDWTDGEITFSDIHLTGLHEVYLIGYDETGFIGVNSWGRRWGNGGKFHMSYEYYDKMVLLANTIDINVVF